jgi:hypothetical protein
MGSIQVTPFQQLNEQLRVRRLQGWAKERGILKPEVTWFERDGFLVEAVGIVVSRAEPAPGHVFEMTRDGRTMLVRGLRIKRDDCRAFVEAWFGGDSSSPYRYNLCDLDPLDLDGNIRALDGLKLLPVLESGIGHPLECFDLNQDAANRLAALGKKVTRAAVAEIRCVEPSAVEQCYRRERKRSGRTWTDSRRRALHSAGRIA